MKKVLAILPVLGMFFLSCDKDEVYESETTDNTKKVVARNSGFHMETIDNGLDGQILFFDSAESYNSVQEDLFNQTHAYLDGYQPQIPTELNDDQLEAFLNSINYNEDIIYEGFEQSIGFNSFRVKLNNDIDQWLDMQTNQEMIINEENDPDNNTLVLESDRTLYNMGGEVVVLDSLQNPIIYKAFDWGHLIIKDFDTDILKAINVQNIKSLDQIQTQFGDLSNIKIKKDFIDASAPAPCMTDNIKDKKHVYSTTGQNNVKSIIKNRNTPFSNSGEHDRLIIKTLGYKWKNGKWRNRELWLVNGFTSKRNQANQTLTWWRYFCDNASHVNTHQYIARSKCVRKFEYDGGSPGNNVAWKNNSIYAYHGEGTFTFTVDFYGSKNSGHEVYRITN